MQFQRYVWKVIYFWSGNCPCVKSCEQRTRFSLWQRYYKHVSFYAIASNNYELKPENRAALRQESLKRRLPFPVLRKRAQNAPLLAAWDE